MNLQELGDYGSTVNTLLDYYRKQNLYAPRTISGFKACYRRLQTVMVENNVKSFSRENSELLLAKAVPKSSIHNEFRAAIHHLLEFTESGEVKPSKQFVKKRKIIFSGKLGERIKGFIAYSQEETKLSDIRIRHFENHLMVFNDFCRANSIDEFSLLTVMLFLKEYKFVSPRQPQYCIECLIQFSKYLYKTKIIPNDISDRIPRYRKVSQPKLPSTFTPEEIKKILAAIDVTNYKGLRDYAIVILAVELGMRATDIMELRLDNIDWKNNVIEFDQVKTGNRQRLPLLSTVRKALSDYIKVRRPSSVPNVFLLTLPPFTKTTHGAISNVFQQAITKSGVELQKRTVGARAFRSSLASNLLANNVGVNVITTILGHRSHSIAKHYLRIDIQNLMQCALDVPSLDQNFYTKNGFIA